MKSPSELNKYRFNSLKGILRFKVNLSWPSLFLYAKRMPIVSASHGLLQPGSHELGFNPQF